MSYTMKGSVTTYWCILLSLLLESNKHWSLFSADAYSLTSVPKLRSYTTINNNLFRPLRNAWSAATGEILFDQLGSGRKKSRMLNMSSDYKRDEVNDILRGMGLQPVQTTEGGAKGKQREKISTNRSDDATLAKIRRIDLKTQLSYAREGHAVLRSLLPSHVLIKLRQELDEIVSKETLNAWQQKVVVACGSFTAAQQCRTVEQCRKKLIAVGVPADELPFLQFFNTWRLDIVLSLLTNLYNIQKLPSVETVCKSPLLANAASQLMGIPRVRLYQDSLFVKRYQDGKTPWHIDARMSPFDTQHFVTFWIPLQDIPATGTGLVFVSKSHSDMALPYWNEADVGKEYSRLEERYGVTDDDDDTAIQHYMPMRTGDVTVHSGWTLHCADANQSIDGSGQSRCDRYALAVSYVDARAEVREDVLESINRLTEGGRRGNAGSSDYRGDDEDTSSFLPWIRDVKPRSQFNHNLVPLVWPTQSS